MTNVEAFAFVMSAVATAGLIVWGMWTCEENRRKELDKRFPGSKPQDKPRE